MANRVDPDQTASIGAVCSGSTLFACILKFASNVRHLFAAEDFSSRHFQMHFFNASRAKFNFLPASVLCWPLGYKTYFMLNSTEHAILSVHRN